MLEIFQQEKSFLTRAKEENYFRYVLNFDSIGAFIEICDKNNKPLNNVDFRVYNGQDREILQLIEQSFQEDFFKISWEDDTNNIYLNNHPRLVELLKLSDKFYTTSSENINFFDSVSKIELNILEEDDRYKIFSSINSNNNYMFINSCYLMSDSTIYQINDIGENFDKLENFNTVIEKDKLEELLSILYTHFENISFKYKDYKVQYLDEKKIIKPAVIFEKITINNELILRTSATLGKLSADFFNDFNISKIALINQLEKNISIYECDFDAVFQIYSDIFKNLSSIKRKIKAGTFSEEDGLFIIDEDIANEFILYNLHTITTKCEIFGSENLKAYKYSSSTPNLNISFKDKIDYLDTGDVTVSIGSEKFKIFDFINLYKKHSYIPLNNGEKSIIDKSYISKLERIFKKSDSKDQGDIKISFFDLPEIEEIINEKDNKVFKNSRKFYEGFNQLKSSKSILPKLKEVDLRDYQKDGVRWLKYLYDNNFGGCLADDMGLGKTLQAITLLSSIYPEQTTPSLIVMPKSLLINWQNELKKFNPTLSFYLYYENNREIKKFNQHNVILTTYAIVRNDIKKLKDITFDTIILDESQNIKNIDSKISKAVMLLNGVHKFALSGTPIENSLFELYSLFRFINNGIFKSVVDFKKDFAIPIQNEVNEDIAKLLKAKITPFILRRLKQDVLKDLPQKQEQVVYIDMDDNHKKFYEEKKNYYKEILKQQISANGIDKSKFVILQAFNDLRQIASAPELKSENQIISSKIENLFEMLEDIILNGHKVLIFANFLGSIELLSQKATENKYEHLVMTGSTKDRQGLVDRFQNEDNLKLLLMTLKVGGVGLNLTKADYVFIFDPWWNKAAENQAVDRAHRMGQKNKVFSYKMITKDTIEEKILELQNKKQDITDMIISGDESGLKKLTSEDLEFILG